MTALGSPPEEIVVTCRGGSPVAIQTDSHSTGKASWSYSTWGRGGQGPSPGDHSDRQALHRQGKLAIHYLGAGRTGSQVAIQTDSHSTGKTSWPYTTWGRGGQGPR